MELSGKVSLLLEENGIVFGGQKVYLTNPHNFFVAGGYVLYRIEVPEPQKPPRAVAYFKGGRLVLFSADDRAVLLMERGQEKLSRALRRDELRLFMDYLRQRTKGVGVEELVFAKVDGRVYLGDLAFSKESSLRLFYFFEENLKSLKGSILLPEGRVLIDKRIFFFRRAEKGFVPVGSVKANVENLLRIMSVL